MPISRRAVHQFLDRRLDSFTWMKGLSRRSIERELAALRVPPRFKTSPWLHQLVCFWIGLTEPRFLFLLDMGLGKSKIIADLITHAYRERRLRRGDHALVVGPRLINVDSWEGDLAKHSDLEPWRVDVESIEEKRERLLHPRGEVTLIDYAGLHLACCDYVKPARARKGRYEYNERVIERVQALHPFVSIDESHLLSNPDSLWFGIMRRLTERAEFVYATTGTLFGKQVEALWPQFYLVDGGETFGENLGMFRAAFFEAQADPWKGTVYKFVQRNDRRLHRMLQHRSIRYDEDEVPEIDLPRAVPYERALDMGAEQREHYMRALEGLINANGTLAELDGAWTRMRQIVSGYLAWKDENADHVLPFKVNPKLAETEAILEAAGPDEKVVIVHYYTETGRMLCERLKALGITHDWLYGGSKDPGAVRRRFMDPRGPRVLVMNSVAGGTGNDGLQEVARYMVLYETPTSPTDRRQVQKRLHRPGQRRRTFFYDLVMRRSLDRGILDDIAAGVDTYQRVVDGTSAKTRSLFLR